MTTVFGGFLDPTVKCEEQRADSELQTLASGLLSRLLSEQDLVFVPILRLHHIDYLRCRRPLLRRRNFYGVIRNVAIPGGVHRNKSAAGCLQQGNRVFSLRSFG